jgi:hypothetical protein
VLTHVPSCLSGCLSQLDILTFYSWISGITHVLLSRTSPGSDKAFGQVTKYSYLQTLWIEPPPLWAMDC